MQEQFISESPKRRRPVARTVAVLLVLVLAVAGCAVEEPTEPTGEQTPAVKEKSATKEKAKPKLTSGQANALEAGQNYIDTMPFSKKGLIQQLSSSAGDGYSKADATFAANHVAADWKKEAVEAAKNYLDTMPMSKDALIEQLSSSAGDKFTPAQARYAASKVY